MPTVHIKISDEQSAALTADVFVSAHDYSAFRYTFMGDSFPAGEALPWQNYRGEWAVDPTDPWTPFPAFTVKGAVREFLAGLSRSH